DALQRYGMASADVPAVVWTVFATSVSQALVMERALGMNTGHAGTFAFCEQWIRRLEGDPLPDFADRPDASSVRA
ncbi:TetR family transcriptional regulator, partial [Mycobacterium sp. ITM-2017-0098]